MDIQQYIAADKELLLNLNGSQSLFWDGFMWVATSTIVWVPVAAMLLYIIIKNNKIQEALLTIVMVYANRFSHVSVQHKTPILCIWLIL